MLRKNKQIESGTIDTVNENFSIKEQKIKNKKASREPLRTISGGIKLIRLHFRADNNFYSNIAVDCNHPY